MLQFTDCLEDYYYPLGDSHAEEQPVFRCLYPAVSDLFHVFIKLSMSRLHKPSSHAALERTGRQPQGVPPRPKDRESDRGDAVLGSCISCLLQHLRGSAGDK